MNEETIDLEPDAELPEATPSSEPVDDDPIWRTHRCGILSEAECGERALLCGFVETHRDHKHQVFLHLRDGSGKLQVVFDGDRTPALYHGASRLTAESIIQVGGRLSLRPPGADRTNLDTRTIELIADRLKVIVSAPPPPFPLLEGDREKVDEHLRLEKRWFELRADALQDALRNRARMVSALRRSLEKDGFLEIETPVLTRQSPEGAREFLVPARHSPGNVFALAQSPQLYKQMLMVGGVERYYQVARCFRDEDGKANRQPEFTQLDLECAYSNEAEIRGVVERAVVAASESLGLEIHSPFPILTWDDAMAQYGVDRPDLRFEMGLVDVTDVILESGFKKLRDSIRHGGKAGLFALPRREGEEPLSNAELDRVREEAISLGAPGLLWFRREGEELRSDPFVERILKIEERRALGSRLPGKEGDAIFLLAAPATRIPSLFSALRSKLALRFGLVRPRDIRPCWVARFPFFEPGTSSPSHHPFTAPVDAEGFWRRFSVDHPIGRVTRSAPAPSLVDAASWPSRAYDLVINGEEIGSGSIRIHDPNLQRLVFRMLGYSSPEIEEKFGFFLRALDGGAPPHGGIALGIDRLLMSLTNREALRDVVAFPKALDHSDPLTGAPAPAPRDAPGFGSGKG